MVIENRRARTLTDDDVVAIAHALEDLQEPPHSCTMNLDTEDVRVLKEIVGGLKKARNTIGTVVLTFLLLGVLGLLTKGFWASLVEK